MTAPAVLNGAPPLAWPAGGGAGKRGVFLKRSQSHYIKKLDFENTNFLRQVLRHIPEWMIAEELERRRDILQRVVEGER